MRRPQFDHLLLFVTIVQISWQFGHSYMKDSTNCQVRHSLTTETVSSLVTLEVVITTASGATSNDIVDIMTTPGFQCDFRLLGNALSQLAGHGWLVKASLEKKPIAAGQAHYGDVIMGVIASQITSLTIVYSTVYSDADQRKYQSSASLVFVCGLHRGPVNSPHKWPVTRKMFPFDNVIMRIPETDRWEIM